jgi:3-oxoacyl-(acyl-carrier-protein) synthase
LIDAITQMKTGEFPNVLVGAADELTSNLFTITSRLGFWKRKPVQTLQLLEDTQRGTIAGEGATFLFLENQKRGESYARLTGVTTFLKPDSQAETGTRLNAFLAGHGLTVTDLSLVILGMNGDPGGDKVYKAFASDTLADTPMAFFKHLCGEYHTATAFGTWMAAKILKTQTIPDVVRLSAGAGNKTTGIEHVLIYNHFRENNHAFILLSRI